MTHQANSVGEIAHNQFSKLYCRLNGFMSGIALWVAAMRKDNLYDSRRQRLNSFFREVEIDLPLPINQAELAANIRLTMQVTIDQLKIRAEELGDFHALALFLITCPDNESRLDPSIAKEISRIKNQYGLAEAPFDYFFKVRYEEPGIKGVIDPLVELLQRLVEPLEVEPETCFVSMPFQADFEIRWGSFYWPLVWYIGMRAVRAWGDIGGESYQALMYGTIDKCGALLADATGNGPNVVNEIGYAQGGKKIVMAMRAINAPSAITNIHPKHIYVYDPDKIDSMSLLNEIHQASLWFAGVRGGKDAKIPLMDARVSPENILDFFGKIAKDKNKSFFGWKGNKSNEREKE